MLLKDKRALITGASRGIGAAIAIKFAKEGAVVGINYNTSEKSAKNVLDEVKRYSDGILLKADVSALDEVKSMIKKFVDKYGGIDVLVCNAGIYIREKFCEMSVENWMKTIDINLNGVFYTVKEAIDYIPRGGNIIIISSQIALKGTEHGAHYAASKAALLGLAKSLALELAPEIRVNCIAPGYVDTDLLSGDTPEKRKWRIEQVPLKRIASPEEIANVCIFLASDMSSYITGETIVVTGGLYIR